MLSRREFIKVGAVAGAGVLAARHLGPWRAAAATGQTQMPGSAIPQFVDPLPALEIITADTRRIELSMSEFQTQVLPTGLPRTWVWGYLRPGAATRDSYIGPVIVATRGTPTEIKWVNDLGHSETTEVRAWAESTDQTLHWADPLHFEANVCAEKETPRQPPQGYCAALYSGPIPATPHLHGGEVPPQIDGGPDSWVTSDGTYKGHSFYSKDGASATNHAILRYPNAQEAAPIWFHDHTFGLTRLGVYAGLAGAYLLVDPLNPPPDNLPPPVPLVIQDRMFDTEGQLLFPAGTPFSPNPEHPFWVPEFVGDTIVVNGKAWPFLEVEPKRYRFLFLNGSNARTYELFIADQVTKAVGPAMWQIGTDGGYLEEPVKIDPKAPKGRLQRLLILPGERADVIIDFAGLTPGATLLMRNVAKTPYPGGGSPRGSTTGRVMQFRVVQKAEPGDDTSYDPAHPGAPLRRAPMVRLVDPARGTLATGVNAAKTRRLTLNEVIGEPMTVGDVEYEGGPLELLLNNTEMPGTDRPDFTPITHNGVTHYYSELPEEGDTEVWEIINLTADAHPVHLHLVQFQLMNRQAFDLNKYGAVYAAAFPGRKFIPGYGPPLDYNTGDAAVLGGNPDVRPFLTGVAKPPAPNEAGWKDTVMAPPGRVTRIVVRWAPTDLPTSAAPSRLHYAFDPSGGHGYVWHCHIIDHEDNEMMRPTSVLPDLGAARTYVEGTDY